MNRIAKQREDNLHFLKHQQAELDRTVAGSYVAIADGKVVAVESTYRDAWRLSLDTVPAALHRCVYLAGSGQPPGEEPVIEVPGCPPPDEEEDGKPAPTIEVPGTTVKDGDLCIDKDKKTGAFVLDITVAGEKKKATIDTGFSDPSCKTGLQVDAENFKKLKIKLKEVKPPRKAHYADCSEKEVPVLEGKVKIDDLGVEVETQIIRGGSNLIGLCFMKKLGEQGYDGDWPGLGDTFYIRKRKE